MRPPRVGGEVKKEEPEDEKLEKKEEKEEGMEKSEQEGSFTKEDALFDDVGRDMIGADFTPDTNMGIEPTVDTPWPITPTSLELGDIPDLATFDLWFPGLYSRGVMDFDTVITRTAETMVSNPTVEGGGLRIPHK